jgi:hypothetical protein
MKRGRIFMMGKTTPPVTNPRMDHKTNPRVMVCRLPILSIKRPPMMQPGRKKELMAVPKPTVSINLPCGFSPEMMVELKIPKGYTCVACPVSSICWGECHDI